MSNVQFRDPQVAFKEAIEKGRLHTDPKRKFCADNYMYMGTVDGCDKFKNRHTRQYLETELEKKRQLQKRKQQQRIARGQINRYTDAGGSYFSDADPGL